MAAMAMPRPGMERKSGNEDFPDDYKRKLLEFRDAAFAQAREGLASNPEIGRIPEYIDLIEGRHWNTRELQRVPSYRSRFVDNRIAAARMDKLAELTDIKPKIDITSEVDTWRDIAQMCDKIVSYEWSNLNLDMKLMQAVDYAMLTNAFWKVTASAPGYTQVAACGPDKVIPIVPGPDIQAGPGVFYVAQYPAPYLINKWPNSAEAIRREAGRRNSPSEQMENPWSGPGSNGLTFAERFRQRSGARIMASRAAFQPVKLTELWVDDFSMNESPNSIIVKDKRKATTDHNYWYEVKPGNRLFPYKRLVVFVGDEVLWDGPNPYWHGMYPFAQLCLRPAVWRDGGGISVYRDLVPLNRAVNKIGAGTMEAIEKAINPTLMAMQGSVNDGDWQRFYPDMPGAKLKISSNAGSVQNAMKWSDAPVLPQYVFQFLQGYLSQGMDRHAGTVDVAGLGRKNQIPGGDTIEQMRDSLQTPLRLEQRQIDIFLRDAGQLAVSNIFQFYTLKRRMHIFGNDGTVSEDFEYNPKMMIPGGEIPRHFHRRFPVTVVPGSGHGSSKDRKKQIAIVLFKIGAISRKDLLRSIEWSTPIDQIERELAEQNAGNLAPDAVGKGRTPRLDPSERQGSVY